MCSTGGSPLQRFAVCPVVCLRCTRIIRQPGTDCLLLSLGTWCMRTGGCLPRIGDMGPPPPPSSLSCPAQIHGTCTQVDADVNNKCRGVGHALTSRLHGPYNRRSPPPPAPPPASSAPSWWPLALCATSGPTTPPPNTTPTSPKKTCPGSSGHSSAPSTTSNTPNRTPSHRCGTPQHPEHPQTQGHTQGGCCTAGMERWLALTQPTA